jgi:putative hemolysin
VEPVSLWFLIASLSTFLFSALATAFITLLRIDPQAFEGENRGVLGRIHQHWPRELGLTLLLFPFLGLTAALVLGSLYFAPRLGESGWWSFLLWAGLTFLLLFGVNLFRAIAVRYPATLMRSLGWLYIPSFFALYPLSSLLGPILGKLRLVRGLEMVGFLVSARDVQDFVEKKSGDDLLEEEEREMISSIIDLRDTTIREVMIPRIDIKALDVETPFAEAREFMAQVGHSRVPVYKESMDHVVGILYSKDLLRHGGKESSPSLIKLMRKPYFVPETKFVGDLLRRFQELRQHLAVVVDEYGGTAGIVTLEDLLEEIVGEIRDEYDQEELLFELIDDHSARVDAKIDLEELGEILGHEFKEVDEDFESLGGLLLYHSGRILAPGDELELAPFTFRVESVQRQRIAKVIIVREGLGAAVQEANPEETSEDES